MKTIIAATAFAATAALSATTASAWTVDQCPYIADAAHSIVEARDDGTEKAEVYITIARADIADDIAALLLMLVDLAFDNRGTTPDQMKTMVLIECVNQFAVNS